jgi:hypothetical protein
MICFGVFLFRLLCESLNRRRMRFVHIDTIALKISSSIPGDMLCC